jgi:hypothetical protein
MTIDNLDHLQQKITAAKSDLRLRLDQVSDATLRRVAIWVAGGVVTGGVLPAASNVGSEQHTWWGWLLIALPLIWLSFLGVVAVTFAVLRIVVGVLRWSWSSRGGAEVSVAASRWTAPQVRRFDMTVNRLARAA